MKYAFLALLVSFFGCIPTEDQAQQAPQNQKYSFIRYDKNFLQIPLNNQDYTDLFSAFNTLVSRGEGQVKVLHIGDSHIQADMISGRIRERMQTFHFSSSSGRGLVFPCTVAGTNNPVNIEVSYSGTWTNSKTIQRDPELELGISGLAIRTDDLLSQITIKMAKWVKPDYDFNVIKVFHDMSDSCFVVDLLNYHDDMDIICHKELGYTEFRLKSYVDSVSIYFNQTDEIQDHFILHGISLETSDPGVIYHAVGVNGAKAGSYLKANLLETHLKALDPDWVIVSFGTNDVYMDDFNKAVFALDYDKLIKKIRRALPGVPVLLTTSGDHYLYNRYPNKNSEVARSVVYLLARKYDLAVWDFYEIMGGLGSISKWYDAGLSGKDHLHFSGKGYKLQGDLLFDAFISAYEDYLEWLNFNWIDD